MVIKNVCLETVCGITSKLPENDKPEIAFAGKSNVGKSSLINSLINRKSLARTSSTPGKTQTINYYNINDELYFVDLPGYGYASVSKSLKQNWITFIDSYFAHRENLYCTFILIDSRLDPQAKDMEFIKKLGSSGIPIALVLTKTDKLKQSELGKSKNKLEKRLLEDWDELPPLFITSAEKKSGRNAILDFIETAMLADTEND